MWTSGGLGFQEEALPKLGVEGEQRQVATVSKMLGWQFCHFLCRGTG